MLRASVSSQYSIFPSSGPNQSTNPPKTPTTPQIPSIVSTTVTEPDDASSSSAEQLPPPPTIFTPTESESTQLSTDSSRPVSSDNQQQLAGQTPKPHIPLRKHASNLLRLRLPSRSSTKDVPSPSKDSTPAQETSLASLAQSLRPDTIRWSQGSAVSFINHEPSHLLDPDRYSNVSTPTLPDRPHTARDLEDPAFLAAAAATDSPPLRPATSAQDYPDLKPLDTSALPPDSSSFSSPDDDEPSTSETTDPAPNNQRRPTLDKDGHPSLVAESVRSAATITSSAPDLSSNDRTSTWTDRSSVSDTVRPDLPWSPGLDEELTVEDCIAMYAQGFTDDPPAGEISVIPEEQPFKLPDRGSLNERTESKNPSSVPTMSSDSFSIQYDSPITQPSDASPTADDDAPPPLPPMPQIALEQNSISSGAQNHFGLKRPPRDKYGFKKETQHVKMDQYNAWEPNYRHYVERRRKKWIHFMNETGFPSNSPVQFPPKSDKVKRYVRKGIPHDWRGAAWFFYSDGAAFIASNPGLYRKLVALGAAGAVSEADREHIERDLHRTLPENKHFKPDVISTVPDSTATHDSDDMSELKDNDMIRSLRRILQAFAIHHPKIGYCQSLNFLAGHLLLFMRSAFPDDDYEERAFALLSILTEQYLPGTHGIVLEGANVDIGVLMMLIQESMPNLWAKLDDNNETPGPASPAIYRQGTAGLPSVSLATTAWFMSCFVSTLPIETTCRVWDCLWYEGSKTIFRVALAIFKLGEKEIRKSKDPMEMFQVVQNLPRSLLNANLLMEVATKKRKVTGGASLASRVGPGVTGFGGLSQKTVEMLREERRQLVQGEKDRPFAGIAPPPVPEEPITLNRSLSRSSSKGGRLKRFKSVKKLVDKSG